MLLRRTRRFLLVSVPTAGLLAGAGAAAAQPSLIYLEGGVRVLQHWSGEAAGDLFGHAISELRDIDGDGAMEVIVGAPNNAAGGPAAGRAYVFSGGTGALLHTFTGEPGETLGFSMADAGDINADGVPDIIIGAPGMGAGGGQGRAYIYSGADGSIIRMLTGEAAGDRFGHAVGGPGDVDGDGRDDVLVTAMFSDAQGTNSGRGYIVSGNGFGLIRTLESEGAGHLFGSGAAGAGDINGDGHGEVIIGARNAGPTAGGRAYVFSGVDGSLLVPVLEPEATGVDFGWFFVAACGDVNADGTTDLYVGDFNDGPGRGYVFSGVDGSRIRLYSGQTAGEGFGPGRGAGDVDGDGHADLVVGSYLSSAGAPSAGRVSVLSGRTGAVLRTVTLTVANRALGYDAVGVGDTDGDGELDFAAGAALGGPGMVTIFAGLCRADFDRDGRLTTEDLRAFVHALVRREREADFTRDGHVNAADLVAYLIAFIRGCPLAFEPR